MTTRILMEIRMEGDARGCKEVAAMELEQILARIGFARVRCLEAVCEEEEQLRMQRPRR